MGGTAVAHQSEVRLSFVSDNLQFLGVGPLGLHRHDRSPSSDVDARHRAAMTRMGHGCQQKLHPSGTMNYLLRDRSLCLSIELSKVNYYVGTAVGITVLCN